MRTGLAFAGLPKHGMANEDGSKSFFLEIRRLEGQQREQRIEQKCGLARARRFVSPDAWCDIVNAFYACRLGFRLKRLRQAEIETRRVDGDDDCWLFGYYIKRCF